METKKITCKKCGYSWETKSELMTVSCPSCLNKVQNKEEVSHNEVSKR